MTQPPLYAALWPPPWETSGKLSKSLSPSQKRPQSIEWASLLPGCALSEGDRYPDIDAQDTFLPAAPDSQPKSQVRSRKHGGPGSKRPGVAGLQKRTCCSNFGAELGRPGLLTLAGEVDALRAPYSITVRYDLRPVANSIGAEEKVFLAALDVERLQSRGLDALAASESWIARDCLCLKSGRLRLLPTRAGPGEVKIVLQPAVTGASESDEDRVLLRVVAIRNTQDPRDWNVLGSAVMLRMDTLGGHLVPEIPQVSMQGVLSGPIAQAPSDPAKQPEFWGIRLRQLMDLRDEILHDLELYCSAHQLCTHSGWHENFHVCVHSPCPFWPNKVSKCDDHRGVDFIKYADLQDEERKCLQPLQPDTSLVVDRYLKPRTSDTGKGYALILNPEHPLKARTFVTHSWGQPFVEFMATLEKALDPEENVFVAALALDHHKTSVDQGLSNEECCKEALQHAEKAVVVMDTKFTLLQRLCCIHEISMARELGIQTLLWPHDNIDLLQLKSAIGELDIEACNSSAGEYTRRIRQALRAGQADCQAANEQFRSFVRLRARCFAEALQQAAQPRPPAERLRALLAERERLTYLREARKEHETLVDDTAKQAEQQKADQQAAELEREQHLLDFEEELASKDESHKVEHAAVRSEAEEQLRQQNVRSDDLELELRQARAELAKAVAHAEADRRDRTQALKQEMCQRSRAEELLESAEGRAADLQANADKQADHARQHEQDADTERRLREEAQQQVEKLRAQLQEVEAEVVAEIKEAEAEESQVDNNDSDEGKPNNRRAVRVGSHNPEDMAMFADSDEEGGELASGGSNSSRVLPNLSSKNLLTRGPSNIQLSAARTVSKKMFGGASSFASGLFGKNRTSSKGEVEDGGA